MNDNDLTKKPKLFENISEPETMDKPVSQDNKKRKKIIRYGAVGIIVLALIIYLIFRDNSSKLNIEADKITIEEVKKDVFLDYISVIGTVEPIQTIYLDATEGGRVEEIYLREGTKVKKGEAIMRLSNDNLLLEISNYEAEVARAINDLKSMRVNLENQEINNKTQLLEYKYDILKLERDIKRNELLFKDKYISEEEYQQGKENYERKKNLYKLLSKKAYQDSVSTTMRIASSEESVESMQRNLAIIRNRLSKLTITAPADGELATLIPELGKVIGYGTPIGSVNILDSYKLRGEIDEHYISRVKTKLNAYCDFSEKEYPALVSKIYPEVSNNRFFVDLIFSGSIPTDIRIGQTSRVRLELGASQTAILIPRGGFYQSTGGQWIYVIDKNEKTAIKRDIKIGRQNPNFYEIVEGLTPGEKVITSNYDVFNNAEKLILKK
jgi:HlyD family secretion protein